MEKSPRSPKETIFADGLGVETLIGGVMIAGLTLGAFFIGNAKSHITGMTMAFLTLSLCEVFHALNMRSRKDSIFARRKPNKFLVGAMLLSAVLTFGVIYIPGLNTVFELVALDAQHFFEALLIAVSIIPLYELVKLGKRILNKKVQ